MDAKLSDVKLSQLRNVAASHYISGCQATTFQDADSLHFRICIGYNSGSEVMNDATN